MIDQIFNLTLWQWSIFCFYFIASSYLGASLMYLFLKHIFKNMIYKEVQSWQFQSDIIVAEYKDSVNNVRKEITQVQSLTIDNFKVVNQNIVNLNKLLSKNKQHQIKVSGLENEIIKYKKIIKRMEKKQC